MPAMVIQPRSGRPPVLQMCRTKRRSAPSRASLLPPESEPSGNQGRVREACATAHETPLASLLPPLPPLLEGEGRGRANLPRLPKRLTVTGL
jgi:hypothetical protein